MNDKPMQNKVAVVTGGAGGIGRAISIRMAAAGATVVILSRDSEKGFAAVREIEQSGGRAHFYQTDLGCSDQIENAAEVVNREHCGADVLVNNAALSGYMGPVIDTPLEEAERTVSVNLISAFHLSQLFLPSMVEKTYGRIINISSVAYRHNPRNAASYNMSKAGLNALTKTLSNEVARHGITVNSIAPGLVLTDRILDSRIPGMAAKSRMSEDDLLTKLAADTPSGRFTQPEEVAELALFLAASGSADNITGEIINIAGGY